MVSRRNDAAPECRRAEIDRLQPLPLWRLAAVAAALAALGLASGAHAQATTTGAAADAPAADAPAASGGQLQDIVITATRHAELLSKVPVSVSAFTQETLDIKGIKDVTDVVRYTPGVQIDLDGTNTISIRGISSSAGAATTGVYLDDTPIQMRTLGFNADSALPKTFDLERMEVLRGPQGTLFGAGAEGGAVRYIMAQPNMHKADGYARTEIAFTQGGDPSYEAGIAGGTPIVDNVLGVRASLWYRHDGGWIDRLDPFNYNVTAESKANYEDSVAARVALKWAVNDDLTITPSMLYQYKRLNDASTYFPVLSDPSSSSYKNAWATPRREPDHYFLPAVKVETELGKASFISNTSFFSRRDRTGYDGTMYNLSYYQQFANPSNNTTYSGVPLSLIPGACGAASCYPFVDASGLHLPPGLQNYRAPSWITNQQQTFAQEFRLQSNDAKAPLVWTAGLFYSVSNQNSVEEINDPMLAQFFSSLFYAGGTTTPADLVNDVFGVPLMANGDAYYNALSTRDKQVAVFGEATYAVTDKLKATAGLRYSKTDSSFSHFTDGPQNYGTSPLAGGVEHDKPFTPKVSVSYQADRDNMFYATFAKGFRVGGGNAPLPAACGPALSQLGLTAAPDSYKSDSVRSYEIGAKNKIGDQLRIASSLYYIKWSGIQQNIYLSCGFQFVDNLGEAVSRGGDIQIEYAPSESWSFDVAMGRTEAHLTSDVGGDPSQGIAPLAAKGDAVEGLSYGPAPPWTITVGAQYDFTVEDHKAFVRMDYEFSGHSGNTTPTEDPRTGVYDPYIYTPLASRFVSLRGGATFDKWNVSLFVDNVLNTHPAALDSSDYHSGVDPFNANPPSVLTTAYTFRPRTMGVTATYHMN